MGTAGQNYVYFEIVGDTIYSSNHACHWNWTINVKLIIKIYGTVIFWFWVLLAFCVITTIIREQWSQTVILAVLMTITFFGFVFAVWLEMTVGDINERLRGYLNHNKLS